MRFLFTTIPGSGHYHPLVSTARALQRRGHEVAGSSRRPSSTSPWRRMLPPPAASSTGR